MDLRSLGILCPWLAAAGLAACSSSAPPVVFPAEALQTLHSRMGQLTVEVRTSPQPPTRGDQSVEYKVFDATGAPVAGLVVEVVPWMPVMDHGTSVRPTVIEREPGTYVVSDVDMFMPGEWELITTFTGPAGSGAVDGGADAGGAPYRDYVSPAFQIP